MTKIVNSELLKPVTSLGRVSHNQEQKYRRKCLEVVCIPSSDDDKSSQSTVYNILGDIDVACDSNNIEDCYRVKGDRNIIRFSS